VHEAPCPVLVLARGAEHDVDDLGTPSATAQAAP
jgi:hypothetical protein